MRAARPRLSLSPPPLTAAHPTTCLWPPNARAQVLAVDINAKRVAMTVHNAGVYGVSARVSAVVADFFGLAATLAADAVFLSPPWGGPFYKFSDTFDVLTPLEGLGVSLAQLIVVRRRPRRPPRFLSSCLLGLLGDWGGREVPPPCFPSCLLGFVWGLWKGVRWEGWQGGRGRQGRWFSAARRRTARPSGAQQRELTPPPFRPPPPLHRNNQQQECQRAVAPGGAGVVLFLPRNTDLPQLAGCVPPGERWQLERNVLNGRLKGVTLYCGSRWADDVAAA